MVAVADLTLVDDLRGAAGPRQRRAIAKAITLLESTRADHRAQGDELLTQLLPHTGKALRLGISEHTVKFHLGSAMTKLAASSRAEAVATAIRRGLISV